MLVTRYLNNKMNIQHIAKYTMLYLLFIFVFRFLIHYLYDPIIANSIIPNINMHDIHPGLFIEREVLLVLLPSLIFYPLIWAVVFFFQSYNAAEKPFWNGLIILLICFSLDHMIFSKTSNLTGGDWIPTFILALSFNLLFTKLGIFIKGRPKINQLQPK